MKRLTDKDFRYVPSWRTNIRDTFQRARNAMVEEAYQQMSDSEKARIREELDREQEERTY